MAKDSSSVVSVLMPCASLMYPSLALSLFHARFTELGITHKTEYGNIRFASSIGVQQYFDLVENHIYTYGNFLGEWLFANALYDQEPDPPEQYLKRIRHYHELVVHQSYPETPDPLETIIDIRAKVEPFLDQLTDDILAYRPQVVGISSMFQQHLASIALAKRLKIRSPETVVVLGGPNCDRIRGIETLRRFPFLDAVVLGEGDLAYTDLVVRILRGETPDTQGVYRQEAVPDFSEDRHCIDAPRISDLDSLPIPDFIDYMQQLEPIRGEIRNAHKRFQNSPRLLLETSRGCWWRACGGCNFCHQDQQEFRTKSAGRAFEEITAISDRYPTIEIELTDPALPLGHFDNLIPMLADAGLPARLTCYARANITREQVRSLRAAGVVRVMPGIESLSNQILRVLNKGTTVIDNIRLLKWCREYDIEVAWNILWGVPGESPDEYLSMARLIPLLSHLQPPFGFTPLYMGRFSNYYEHPEAFGIGDITPAEAYSSIYPFDQAIRERFALYFNFTADLQCNTYLPQLTEAVNGWIRSHPVSRLSLVEDGDIHCVLDTRPVARRSVYRLTPLQKAIMDTADGGCTMQQILRTGEVNRETLARELEFLVQMRLVIELSGKYISLAVQVQKSSQNEVLGIIANLESGLNCCVSDEKLPRQVRLVTDTRDCLIARDEILWCFERKRKKTGPKNSFL